MAEPMIEPIDSPSQLRQALRRAVAIRAALQAIQAHAIADRDAGVLANEDLRDLSALDDALSDLGYTLRNLETAIDDWEDSLDSDRNQGPAADRAWHRRRSL